MEPNTQQIIKQQIAILPPTLVGTLTDDSVPGVVAAIGDLYELTEEQRGALQLELIMTLLGLELLEDLPERVKTEVGVTDELRDDILDSLANMLLNGEVMLDLVAIERAAKENENNNTESTAPPVAPHPPEDKKSTIPQAAPTKEYIPKEGAAPEPSGNVAQIKASTGTTAPSGKMVSLKKEEVESAVKGMRTMRGDINRLKGPGDNDQPDSKERDEPQADASGSLRKPFRGT